MLGTTGSNLGSELAGARMSYKDFTLNGRTFSSSGLPPLPQWAHAEGIEVGGDGSGPGSLGHTLSAPLDPGSLRHTDQAQPPGDESGGMTLGQEARNYPPGDEVFSQGFSPGHSLKSATSLKHTHGSLPQSQHSQPSQGERPYEDDFEPLDSQEEEIKEEEMDSDDSDEGEVIVPKPLNDVSNVFFSNGLPQNDVTKSRPVYNENQYRPTVPHLPEATSPTLPINRQRQAQGESPLGPQFGPDDSWFSNPPTVPHFHRLSDLDRSDLLQHSVNETLATITDALGGQEPLTTISDHTEAIVTSDTQRTGHTTTDNVHEELAKLNASGATIDSNNVDLSRTQSSQKSPSYHSDYDEQPPVDTKSGDELSVSSSKKKLAFETEESQHESEGQGKGVQKGSDQLERGLDSRLASRGSGEMNEGILLDDEDPTRWKSVSRTSLSPGSRYGVSLIQISPLSCCQIIFDTDVTF